MIIKRLSPAGREVNVICLCGGVRRKYSGGALGFKKDGVKYLLQR